MVVSFCSSANRRWAASLRGRATAVAIRTGLLRFARNDGRGLAVLVLGLQARKLEALADPFGELVEVERLGEDDSGAAVRIPAHLALDRLEALDDHHDRHADAIFLDWLDLHSAERDVVHVDRVIDLADLDRCLAANFEPR